MVELLDEYVRRFKENFPIFCCGGTDEEIEAIIRDCLDKGVPYEPHYPDDPNFLY